MSKIGWPDSIYEVERLEAEVKKWKLEVCKWQDIDTENQEKIEALESEIEKLRDKPNKLKKIQRLECIGFLGENE